MSAIATPQQPLSLASPSEALDLERTGSHPSLTHSATSSSASAESDDEQLEAVISSVNPDPRIRSTTHLIKSDIETPFINPTPPPALEVAINSTPSTGFSSSVEEGEQSAASPLSPIREVKEVATPKKSSSNRLNLSKSMQSLRKKKSDKGGRERASSVTEKVPPVPSLPAEKKSAPPPAPVHSQSVNNAAKRPPLQSAKSGSFSSFLRKLTGRSSTASEPTKDATLTKRKSMMFTSTTTTAPAAKPKLGRLNTASLSNLKGSANTPKSTTAPLSSTSTVKPALPPTVTEESAPKETDPCMIALPPSPDIGPVATLPAGAAAPVDFSAAPTSPVMTISPSATVNRKKPETMLSLEGFEFEGEVEDMPTEGHSSSSEGETLVVREESEKHDVVKPLAPIRIPASLGVDISKRGPASATSPTSASTLGSSIETKIQTPTSAVSELSSGEGMKLAGSSPPRKAPVGVGLGLAELGRKESKWRKSVIGLSEKTNSMSRRQTQKASPPKRAPPPTSHDAYIARQQRIAANRTSCAPTLHSTASVAASARGMAHLSKEDEEMAETFFLS
ncbi:hypothetical protein CI109_106841 [Kwoniella shandongensis]|uniref:Uncharacterized protein n=1 Tax=Kwoniella shandongensis TaxID=1734106 RepID=A0A5M6C6S0_9TREE|nr:uncharacterized protein CI109_000903 [Kwoniella shandongensis]KAA5530723.1 hypothetical protein CI109_000903 [Kwoniella shandongensis]